MGDGPDYKALKASAKANVEFTGALSGESLRGLYRNARLYLLPGEEDFGISVVEAQACGTPVIAYGQGGATETVLDGVTGLFFHEPTAASLQGALDNFGGLALNSRAAREHALRLLPRAFQESNQRLPPGQVAGVQGQTVIARHRARLSGLFLVSDVLAIILSFLYTYLFRFYAYIIPVDPVKGVPPIGSYLVILPIFLACPPLRLLPAGLLQAAAAADAPGRFRHRLPERPALDPDRPGPAELCSTPTPRGRRRSSGST